MLCWQAVKIQRREALYVLAAASAACLFGGRRARASTVVGVTLSELVQRSTLVAFSRSLEASGRWEDVGGSRRIVTYQRVQLDEVLIGQPPAQDLWVRTLGGRVGDVAQIVFGEAELRVGDPCLLFVHPTSDGVPVVTELAQGHYPLRPNGGTLRLYPSPRLDRVVGADGTAVKALIGRTRAEATGLLGQVGRGAK
jgi:hypothetical protein